MYFFVYSEYKNNYSIKVLNKVKGSVNSLIGSKRNQVFEFLFQQSQSPVFILSPNQNWIDLNDAAKELFLLSSDIPFHEMLDKESKNIWFDFLDEVKTHSTASCQLNFRPKSQKEYVSSTITGYYDPEVKELFFCMKECKSLPENNISYVDFFKHAKHGLILSDLAGTIVDINHQAEDYFSIKKEQVLGLPVMHIHLLFKESTKEIEAFYQQLKVNNFAEMIIRRYESNNTEKYYHFKTSFNKVNNLYVTVIRDESEVVCLRKKAAHTDSLSTLGQLAASIAHEIRNPMTSLKGFTQLLSQTVTGDGARYIQVIENELNRMDEILNEFLVLSKPTNRTKDIVCINSLLNQVIEFMQPQAIMYNTVIHDDLSEMEETCILGDSYELKKVFINILKNAIEEMTSEGVIRIYKSITFDNKVKISISDQGRGMTKEQIDQVFLPFFTTKQNGTGLGLSHAIQTVEQHGGFIEIESELNRGTTFHLYLPLSTVGNKLESNSILLNSPSAR